MKFGDIAEAARSAVRQQRVELAGKPVIYLSVHFGYRDYGIPKESEDQCGYEIRKLAENMEQAIKAALPEGGEIEVEVSHGDKNYFNVNINARYSE